MARPGFTDTDNKPKGVTKASLKRALRITRFLKPYKWTYAVGMIFLALTSGTMILIPRMFQLVIDNATLKYVLLTFGVLLLQAIFSYCRVVLFVNVTEKASQDSGRLPIRAW